MNSTAELARPGRGFVTGSDAYMRRRILWSGAFRWLCLGLTYSAIGILGILLGSIFWNCLGRLSVDFLRSTNSSDPVRAGMLAGIWGSFWLTLLTGAFSIPIGLATAVYLEEHAANNRLNRIIKVNLANLAGVPSIVYGMLGLTVFVHMFDLFEPNTGAGDVDQIVTILGFLKIRVPDILPLGDVVLAGALTMTLVVLPTIVIASQEALRAVPESIRIASLALGATRWQTVWRQVLPAALPGIATGVILSMSRAIGETAPLIMVGALTRASFCPGQIDSPVKLVTQPGRIPAALFDQYTAMPIEIFSWARQPDDRFSAVAASGIVTLLLILLTINGLAMYIRQRSGRHLRW